MRAIANKSKYETHVKPHIAKIKKAIEDGADIPTIAKSFGVGTSSFYKYAAEHEELSKALTCAYQTVVMEVKDSMIRRARGYDITESRTTTKTDADGNTTTETVEYRKHIPASEKAAEMVLRNYDPSWRDKDRKYYELKERELNLKERFGEDGDEIANV